MYITDGERTAYLGGLGKMTPEQEALHKQTKQFFKAQRKAVKGHAARVAAGVNKKTQRQTLKALKQAYKEGLPVEVLSPMLPSTPVVPISNPNLQAPSGVPTLPGGIVPIAPGKVGIDFGLVAPGKVGIDFGLVAPGKVGIDFGLAPSPGTQPAQSGEGFDFAKVAPWAAAAAALFFLT